MTVLYIIGGILLLLFVISLLKVKGFIIYDNGIIVGVTILWFTFKKNLAIPDNIDDDYEYTGEKKEEAKEKKKSPDIKSVISLIKKHFIKIFSQFKKYAFLERYKITCTVATGDACTTSLLYAGVCSIVGTLTAFIASIDRKSKKKENIISVVTPDFMGEKTTLSAEIFLSFRVYQLVMCAKTACTAYKEYKSLPSKDEKSTTKGEKTS